MLATSVQTGKRQALRSLWIGGRLWIGAVVAVLLSATMAGIILAHVSRLFLHARHDVATLEQLRLVLDTANRISAERAPSNVLMSGGPGLPSARDRLRAARAQTDQALARGAAIVPAALLQDAVRHLARARALVDQAASQPPAGYGAVQNAVDALFAAYDAYRAVVLWRAAPLIRFDPELAGPVQHALILCFLRDDAGRLGSTIIAPLVAHAPISSSNIAAGDRLSGRIAMQWQLLALDPDLTDGGSRLAALRAEAETAYFGDGQPLVAGLIAEGRHGGAYTSDAAAFSGHYVETLTPLEIWRTACLDALLARYRQKEHQALDVAWIVGGMMLVVVWLIAGGVLLVHLRVLRPLLEASEAVVALVHDQPVRLPLSHPGGPELRPLIDAVALLDIKLRERAAQARQLKYQAETDELTGLLNRRAFLMLGEPRLAGAGPGERVFFILLDIDHFKAINDRHGHTSGDRVLVAVANALRAHVRPCDLVARIGGEEFAILIQAPSQGIALSLAHRLRQSVAGLAILSTDGARVSVTASFGVAAGDGLIWRQCVAKADVALYAAKRAGRNRVHLAEQDVFAWPSPPRSGPLPA
ncbi:GGDEF domain-containing protein [Gluconacetobacter sacchari]|nr:GGDEF domain-containing protein [Gluconacetobacter sacchari]